MIAERHSKPGEDDDVVEAMEFSFAIPVYVRPLDYQVINVLLDRIVGNPANQLIDGCHWMAGQGSKPSFSKCDSLFLGKPVDPNAPTSGEPTFDDAVFFAESAARPYHDDEEKAKSKASKRKYLKARLKHELKLLREYAAEIEAEIRKEEEEPHVS